MNADYSNFNDKPQPSNEQMAQLGRLVDESQRIEMELVNHERKLKSGKSELDDILDRQIPTLMQDMGLTKVTTADGLNVELDHPIEASIPKDQEAIAFKWLEDNAAGGLLKRMIGIEFGMHEEQIAKELLTQLEGKFAGVSLKTTIHHSTLKAFVRERLREGKPLTDSHINIYPRTTAKITARKK